MQESPTRRHFLTGRYQANPQIIRPPWAGGEFSMKCNSCGECVSVCPQNILTSAGGEMPSADFSVAGCDFCGECVDACEPGALSKEGAPFLLEAVVSGRCIAVQGVVCRSCQEICEAGAVRFQLGLNGKSYPIIDEKLCTGCGFCVAPCPTGAIELHATKLEEVDA